MQDATKPKQYRHLTTSTYCLLLFVAFLVSSTPLFTVFSSPVAHAASSMLPGSTNPAAAMLVNAIDMHQTFSRPAINTATTPPPYAVSRYIKRPDIATPVKLISDGCNQGLANTVDVVILDFGQPWFMNSTYGTNLLDGTGFVSIFDIEKVVQFYLNGFWRCASSGSFIALAIGTSNDGRYTNSKHGHAWATLVNAVNSWIISQGFNSKEIATGASDMELGFNTPVNSRAWADGYLSNSQYRYLDYGDSQSCPTSDSGTDRACGNTGWHQSDVVYVSWDNSAALPFPEIYTVEGSPINQANQWQSLSYYSYKHPNSQRGQMLILGSLTQYKACQQNPGDKCHQRGVDNTPGRGWTLLYNELNANKNTAQSLSYSSDIRWDDAARTGNMWVTGHDADYHCSQGDPSAGAGCHYLQVAVNFVLKGSKAPILALDHGSEVAAAITNAFGSSAPTVDTVDPRTGFAGLPLVDSSGKPLYSAIIVASDITCGGCDNNNGVGDTPDSNAINARAADINAYLNAGGGILALAGAQNISVYYNFLPIAVTGTTVTAPFTFTEAGLSLSLIEGQDDNCCITHNSFRLPPAGILEVLETDNAGNAETLATTGE